MKKGRNIEETCASNSEKVKKYAQRLPQGHWIFIGPGEEMKWYATRNFRLEGKWNSKAEKWYRTSRRRSTPFSQVSVH